VNLTITELYKVLTRLTDMSVSVPWIPLHDGIRWTERDVGAARLPRKMKGYPRMVQPVIRKVANRWFLLTTASDTLSFEHSKRAFFNDIQHDETRPRELTLSRTLHGKPNFVETYHLRRTPGKRLVALNAEYVTDQMLVNMHANGYNVLPSEPTVTVMGDIEVFFSREYAERHGIAMEQYLPEMVEKRLQKKYEDTPELAAVLQQCRQSVYPQSFMMRMDESAR
jgi:hypothetical protein